MLIPQSMFIGIPKTSSKPQSYGAERTASATKEKKQKKKLVGDEFGDLF